ncbi:MAG: NAD-dependent deacylase [Bacteroidetes bacterium]|nr:NAD-dependent deacylase [Bacteroidota bacterium]
MAKTKLVVFTGAGVSAESGIKTFRDAGGLWEEHRVEDVASAEGWNRNPELVLNFYNARRRRLIEAEPNKAHHLIAKLEEKYEVNVITQNVDNLHERGGSTQVLHLHGELMKVRSTTNKKLVYDVADISKNGIDIYYGDKCELGSILRPHIVFFGEAVPNMSKAIKLVADAEIFCIIGTSLAVYPAASLLHYVDLNTKVYLVDPNPPNNISSDICVIPDKATTGVAKLMELV